jgi:hypothetical protein
MVFFPRWRSSMWTTILGTARSAFSTTTRQCLLRRCMPTQMMNTRIAAGFLNKLEGRTPRVRLCASPCHREPPGQTGGGEHDAISMTVGFFDLASLFCWCFALRCHVLLLLGPHASGTVRPSASAWPALWPSGLARSSSRLGSTPSRSVSGLTCVMPPRIITN